MAKRHKPEEIITKLSSGRRAGVTGVQRRGRDSQHRSDGGHVLCTRPAETALRDDGRSTLWAYG